MKNTVFLQFALKNFHDATIPEITRKLMKDITMILMAKLQATVFLSGSFQSHTAVGGYSDIDMLAIFERMPDGESGEDEDKDMSTDEATRFVLSSQKNPKDFIFMIADTLMQYLNFMDIDVDYDPPAICVRHLSQPAYPIEITPAFRTSDFGFFLGQETCDYLILHGDFSQWVITNPLIQRRTADYLNARTDNVFSYLCNLLKMWKKGRHVNMLSFGIETFMYHWLRGSLTRPQEFDWERINGKIGLSFPCKALCDTIEEELLLVITGLISCMKEAANQRQIFTMKNPFVRMASGVGDAPFKFVIGDTPIAAHSMVSMCPSVEAQEQSISALEDAAALLQRILSGQSEDAFRDTWRFFGLEGLL